MAQVTIAIIGAGFSGSALSLQLQTACPPGTRVCLIERSGRFGPGLAHATDQAENLLNVPVERMSAFPDRPTHFLDWLRAQPEEVLLSCKPYAEAFVPRRLFGEYVSSLMPSGKGESQQNMIEMRAAQADVIARFGDRYRVGLADGTEVVADKIVLATGNGPTYPPHPDAEELAPSGLWQADPWCPEALQDLPREAAVMIVGTGLSMVDLVMQLLDRGHSGPIITLSRNGLLPATHLPGHSPAYALPTPLPANLTSLVRVMHQELRKAREAGVTWHSVIDAVRPFVQALWHGFSMADKRRFVRHVRPLWDIHRHRMPQASADRIAALRQSGQMTVLAGRLTGMDVSDGRAEICYQVRGTGRAQVLKVDRVLNCTGPSSNVARSQNGALLSVISSGIGRSDAMNMGLDVTEDCRLIGRNGVISEGAYAMGPLTKGTWWEITAVPNIRDQCRDLACIIATDCRADSQPLVDAKAASHLA